MSLEKIIQVASAESPDLNQSKEQMTGRSQNDDIVLG